MYNIGYRERNRIAQELSYDAHIDTDKALLRRYAPKSSLLVRALSSSNGSTLSYDILYTLLQYCTKDEILANRKAAALQEDAGQESPETVQAPAEPADTKKKEDETGRVSENRLEESGGSSDSESGADILGQGEPAPGSAEAGSDARRESDPGDDRGDGGEVHQEQIVL